MKKKVNPKLMRILIVTAIITTIGAFIASKSLATLLSFGGILITSVLIYYADVQDKMSKSKILPFLKSEFSDIEYNKKAFAVEKDDEKIEDLVRYRLIPTTKKNGKVKDLEIEKSFTSSDFELFTLNNINKDENIAIKNTVVSSFTGSKNCRVIMQKDKNAHFPVTENNKDFSNIIFKDTSSRVCTDNIKTNIPEELIDEFRTILNDFGDFGLIVKDGKCSMIFYEDNDLYTNKKSVEKVIDFLEEFEEKTTENNVLDKKIENTI